MKVPIASLLCWIPDSQIPCFLCFLTLQLSLFCWRVEFHSNSCHFVCGLLFLSKNSRNISFSLLSWHCTMVFFDVGLFPLILWDTQWNFSFGDSCSPVLGILLNYLFNNFLFFIFSDLSFWESFWPNIECLNYVSNFVTFFSHGIYSFVLLSERYLRLNLLALLLFFSFLLSFVFLSINF